MRSPERSDDSVTKQFASIIIEHLYSVNQENVLNMCCILMFSLAEIFASCSTYLRPKRLQMSEMRVRRRHDCKRLVTTDWIKYSRVQ